MSTEIYISSDCETNGPIPGPHSMLSLGAAAFTLDSETPISTFYVNLLDLPGSQPDPNTEAWWNEPSQAKAKQALSIDRVDPKLAMEKFSSWVSSTCKSYSPVFVAYPAGFDFLFVYWYLRYFGLSSPFAMATLGGNYRNATKKNMPKRWFAAQPHTHIAIDDAVEQGIMFLRMKKENDLKKKVSKL